MDNKELSERGDTVIQAVSNGDITPTEASSLMSVISSQARIIEIDELERRVSELENKNESG